MRTVHSYEVPEAVALAIVDGLPEYLNGSTEKACNRLRCHDVMVNRMAQGTIPSLGKPTRARYWVIVFAITLAILSYIDRVASLRPPDR